MIGFYTVARMMTLIQVADVSTGVEIFAGITIVVALGGMLVLAFMSAELVTAATTATESLRGLSY